MASSAKKVAGFGAAAVGIGAGVAFMKDAVTTTVTLAKATAGLARITGMSTRESSRWVEVAKTRGVEGKALNMGFISLSKNMDAATEKGSKQAKMFDKLGVSAETIKKGKTGDAIVQVSDAFAKLPEGAQKATLAQKLFGRQAQALLPLLNDGSKSLQEQLLLSDKYGATLGKNAVAKAIEAAKAQRELTMAMDGVKIAFATKVLPALTSAGRATAGWISDLREGKGEVGRFAASLNFNAAFQSVKRFLGQFRGDFQNLKQIVSQTAKIIGPILGAAFDFAKSTVGRAIPGIVTLFKGMAQAIRGIVQVISGILTLDFGKAWTGVKNIFGGQAKMMVGYVRAMTAPMREAASRVGGAIGSAFSSAWSGVKNVFKRGIDAVKGVLRDPIGALGDIARTMMRAYLAPIKQTVGRIPGIFSGAWQRVKNGIGSAFAGIKSALESWLGKLASVFNPVAGVLGIDKIKVGGEGGGGRLAKPKPPGGGPFGGPGFAQGGFLQGRGRQDTVPIMAAPGEAVLNRHQQAPVEMALQSTYGMGLDDLFGAVTQPHYMAKGGRVRRGGKSIVSLGRRLQGMGYSVGEHPAFGGISGVHVRGSRHYSNAALDINADGRPGGEARWLDRLAGMLRGQGWHVIWRAPGHFDHLHVDDGGSGGGGGGALPSTKLPGLPSAASASPLGVAMASKIRGAAQRKLSSAPSGGRMDTKGFGGKAGGDTRKIGRSMMLQTWAANQWPALNALWSSESGWRANARNPSSGAFGIPQSLPASKMASAGADWRTNPATQIKWGLGYIKSRYGSPSRAYAHWKKNNWYARGGFVGAAKGKKPKPLRVSHGSTRSRSAPEIKRAARKRQLERVGRRRERQDALFGAGLGRAELRADFGIGAIGVLQSRERALVRRLVADKKRKDFASYNTTATELKSTRDRLREMQTAEPTDSGGDGGTDENTAAIEELNRQIEEQRKVMEAQIEQQKQIVELQKQQIQNQQNLTNVSQSQYGVLAEAIAAVVSGQIGGKLGLSFQSPTVAGSLGTY